MFLRAHRLEGGNDNVAHSTGTITKVESSEDGDTRYTIRNDNTGKETSNYQVSIDPNGFVAAVTVTADTYVG